MTIKIQNISVATELFFSQLLSYDLLYHEICVENHSITTRYIGLRRVRVFDKYYRSVLVLFENFGYLGILVISFVSSIIVFVPVPYFPILIAASFNKQLNPNIVSLSSAVGVIIAKMIIFYASYYGRNILSNTAKKRLFPLQRV